jgi:DNA-binding transcriptional LysR family regulator
MKIPYTFKQLQYFVCVAQQGSVSIAARKLGISQPSVSSAITQLELQLGHSLFTRNIGQGVTLTPIGLNVLKQAKGILVQSENLTHCASLADGELAGSLALTCFTDIAPFVMPNLICEFAKAYPKVDISLAEKNLKEVYFDLLSGRADVAISFDLGLDKSVNKQTLFTLPPYVMLASNHPLALEKSIEIKQLADEPLIIENLPLTQEYFLSLFYGEGLKPHIKFQVDSFETQRGLVAKGLGVAISCTRPFNDTSYDGSALICIPLQGIKHHPKVVIAQRDDNQASIIARRFVETAIKN